MAPNRCSSQCSAVQWKMDWSSVLNAKPEDIEGDKSLLESLYTFFSIKELPQYVEEGM